MNISEQPILNTVTYCAFCYQRGNSRCGKCQKVFYCSRQHQIDHWPVHKKECKKPEDVQSEMLTFNSQAASSSNFNTFNCSNLSYDKGNTSLISENIFDVSASESSTDNNATLDFPLVTDDIFSSFNNELCTSENNFWDLINSCNAPDLYGSNLDKERAIANISEALQTGAPTPQLNENTHLMNNLENLGIMRLRSLHDICDTVVRDLGTYGICVLDNFVGSNLGILILNEVKNLYMKGIFRKGKLVESNIHHQNESVRNDVTTWVDGTEPPCSSIGNLIKTLDFLVAACNKHPTGQLAKYKLNCRTKAMIACYPGDGTYYKKHVDNPNRDGRCITCIYYLNQNWNTKQNGGLLRMFPAAAAVDDQVANIDPIFDRMILFWSDKRNPHEVLPAFATRFAITVWYFDADERKRALAIAKNKSSSQNRA